MNEPLGYFAYRLYRLGWRQHRFKQLHPLLHLFLSSLYHYRRGFRQADEWSQQLICDRT